MFERRNIAVLMLLAAAATALAQEPRLQDPTRPYRPVAAAAGGGPAEQGFALTGVLVSETRRIAVINGRFYREGDRINGEEILRIEPGSIRIRRNGEVVTVSVKESRSVARRSNDGDRDQ